MFKILLKILDPDLVADDFQNLISFSVLVIFYEDQIGSFYVKMLTDKQTNKHTQDKI